MDIAASAISRVLPARLSTSVERVRHDLNGLLHRAPPLVREGALAAPSPVPLSQIDPVEHLLPTRGLRERWVRVKTDVAWLRRDLSGAKRPPLVTRGRSRYRADAPSALTPRPVRVQDVVRETPDAVSLHLREMDGRPLAFTAGQFLTLHLSIEGRAVRRAYSLSSSPLEGPTARITIKRIEGGLASSWLQSISPGATLYVLGPSGSFVADQADRELAMIAGGSGITPVLSIAETALAAHPDARVWLLYGNRRREDVIFRAALEELADRYPRRLYVEHALETPPAGWPDAPARLDRARIDAWLDRLPREADRYFTCGPAPVRDAAREALLSRGVSAERVREERFHSPAAQTPPELPSEPVQVTFLVRGRTVPALIEPGRTLLEAGLEAGAGLPFSCAMGGCGACKGRLVEGRVAMEEPNCLTPTERSQGLVLTCCARPLEAARVEIA